MNRHVRGVLAGTAVTAALGMTVLGVAACGNAQAGGSAPSPAGASSSQPRMSGGAASAAASGGLTGGGTSAPVPAASAAALCMRVPSLTRVIISHVDGVGTSHMRTVMPLGVMVRDPARVQALASALCALPRLPGLMHCPAMFRDTSFRLVFGRGQLVYPVITVQTTGCRAVTGLGPARTWARSPGLWRAVIRALDAGHALLPMRQGSVPTP